MTHKIAPSLLSADFGNLQAAIEMVNQSEADWLHLDIMDGVFVPNISFGFPVLKYVKEISTKPLDVHLMITDPIKFIKEIKEIGAYMMNVHYETCVHLHRTVEQIKENGMKAGVTLNPHTPVSLLEDIVSDVDMVLIMSVNPGFGGQKFIPYTLEKIKKLRGMLNEAGLTTDIEVDGGVNAANVREVLDAGANVIVAGSAVFKIDAAANTKEFLKIFDEFGIK